MRMTFPGLAVCSSILAAGAVVLGGDAEREQQMKLLELRKSSGRSSGFEAAKVHTWSRSKPMKRDGERERARRLRQMGRAVVQAA